MSRWAASARSPPPPRLAPTSSTAGSRATGRPAWSARSPSPTDDRLRLTTVSVASGSANPPACPEHGPDRQERCDVGQRVARDGEQVGVEARRDATLAARDLAGPGRDGGHRPERLDRREAVLAEDGGAVREHPVGRARRDAGIAAARDRD